MTTTAQTAPAPDTIGVMLYRGTREFAAWLADLADDAGMPTTVMVDQAVREFAAKRGFRPMPCRPARRPFTRKARASA